MAKVSLREAAKRFEVSRPTLTKALNSGDISGEKNGKGQWIIDTAELQRKYLARPELAGKEPGKNTALNRGLPNNLQVEMDALKAQLADAEKRAAVAEALADERAKRIEDFRRMLPVPGERKKLRWWPW